MLFERARAYARYVTGAAPCRARCLPRVISPLMPSSPPCATAAIDIFFFFSPLILMPLITLHIFWLLRHLMRIFATLRKAPLFLPISIIFFDMPIFLPPFCRRYAAISLDYAPPPLFDSEYVMALLLHNARFIIDAHIRLPMPFSPFCAFILFSCHAFA